MPFQFPADERSRSLGYALNPLDRMSEQRGDETWVASLRDDPAARFVLFVEDKVVIDPNAGSVLFDRDTALALGLDPAATALLGLDGAAPPPSSRQLAHGRAPRFAGLAGADPAFFAERGLDAIDLRSLVLQGAVPAAEAGAVAQGRALFNWHATHPFCARCGSPSRMVQAGYRRDCPACGGQHFPRTDPVVIMAIIAEDRILLGRQSRFPPGMYSCLAGFLEPGETIEDAVRRETWEEAGIHVGGVAYHSSQPWPFPASLMIGCLGEALTTDIVPDETELEDCRWFSRDEAVAMLADSHPAGISSPKPIAIAHHLLRAFVEAG